MPSNRALWPTWARFLQRWGLGEAAATMLDAAGPIAVFGAQAIYLGQPFLDHAFPAGHLQALADLLEDRTETTTFAAYLREETNL